jgi:hypothetical protein
MTTLSASRFATATSTVLTMCAPTLQTELTDRVRVLAPRQPLTARTAAASQATRKDAPVEASWTVATDTWGARVVRPLIRLEVVEAWGTFIAVSLPNAHALGAVVNCRHSPKAELPAGLYIFLVHGLVWAWSQCLLGIMHVRNE